MSDSVANLTVKVDTKSVSAAVKALDALAATAAKVEKSVGNIGAASAKQSQSAQSLEKWVSKSESAFAKMEKRLEEGAKKYEQVTRLVNKHALSEGMRADTMNRVNRAFEQYNRVASNVNASTLQIDRATRRYNQAIEQTKTGIDSVMRLERQRATEAKKNAAETVRAAKEAMQGSRAVFRQAGGYQNLIDHLIGDTPQQRITRRDELAKLRSQIERTLTPATGTVLRQAGGYQNLIDHLIGDTPQQRITRRDELAKLRSQIERTLTPATGTVLRQAGGYQDMINRLTSGGTGRQNDLASFYADQEKKATAQIDKSARALQAKLQQAQGAAQGIILRAGRQLSPETGAGIIRQAEVALARYTSALNTHGVKSLEADRAAGAFKATMRGLSSEIARVGGLLPRISDNARVFSAAFGAANASLGGFSRVVFSTTAALSALSGTLALREIIQAGLEIDKFVNTLKTVSEGSLGFQRNLNFLFEEANRVGFAVGNVGNSFARLSLAMKGAGFQGAETREVFSELVGASRNFGLSSAETMGVIRALEQSMSKGKFMAEEVRNQMGDRLPVAMAALERAVTKVDGKQSDLNKRFEEGTIDTRRYAVEFVRQIYALSGGAETLNRTSQSVGSAFGRLTTELTKTNMLFKEAGFDEALISTTDQIRKLIETARESGAVEVLAKSLVTLANNLDLVAGALTAFAAVGFVRILTALASKWVAISIAVAAVGAGIAGLMRGPARDLDQFDNAVKQFDKTYANLSDRITAVNAALISGTSRAASSAESDFEKLITSYRKLGYEASKALVMALKVQEEEAKRSVKELETRIEEAQNRLSSIMPKAEFFQVVSSLQQAAGALPAYNTQISKAVENLNAWYESVKKGEMPLADFVEKLSKIQSEMKVIIEKTPDGSGALSAFSNAAANFIKIIQSPVNLQNIGNAISEVLRLTGLLGTAQQGLQSLTSIRQNIEGGRPLEAIPPVENLPMAAGARTRLNFSGYVSVKEAQDVKAGEKVLQDAYRQTTKDTKAVVDTTLFLEQVRAAADARIPGARKILDDYNEALAKNDKKASGAEKSLRRYTETLEIEIQTHQGLLDAYKQSTLAGEDMEVQIKAQTKALDYGVKGSEAYKKALAAILPLMRERTQQEKDTEAVKANTEQREREIALLEKERSLLGESVALREQELAAFRARQQLKGSDPGVVAEAEQLARKTVKLRQENQQLESSYNELANIGVKAFEQVGDAITEAFAKGEIRALNFGNVIRGVMSSIVQSILRLGVVNPIINSIFSGTMLPTLGAGLSVLGGGAAAAGAAAGGGPGIMQMLGLSSLIPKEGIFGSLGLTGPGGLLSTQIFAPYGVGTILEPSIATGAAGLMAPSGGLTLGGFLGAAGLGFGAGTFLNSMIGGNQMGGMVGSGLGSAAGALLAGAGMLGPLGPIAAALIGGLAGGGLGGLIGPKPSSKGFGYALRGQQGGLAMTDMFYNEQGRAQFEEASAKINAINAYLKQRGLTVSGDRAVGGNRFGMGNLGYGEAASFNEALASMRFAAAANEELNKALSTRSFAGPEKLQEFVDGFIALQDTIKGLTADPVPEFKKQMDALIDSFAQAAAKAREYGVNEEELLAARDKAIAKLEEQRNLTLRDMALNLTIRRLTAQGMDQEVERIQMSYNAQKEIESFTASIDALGITAEEKSKLLIALEETQAIEREKVIKESTKNIRDYLDSLRTSSELSGTTGMGRLAAAQDIFSRDLAAAQAGDKEAISRITQSADTLLNIARSIYGSSTGFFNIRNQVVPGLEGLVNAPPTSGPQSLMKLADVPLVSQVLGARQDAALTESLGYSQRFDEKLAALLPIAEDIRDAVQQANQDLSTSLGSVGVGDYTGPDSSAEGGFGGLGGMDSGGGGAGMQAALGAVMKYGRVTAYAYGGIPDFVNSPTMAPMALFGEAGPEAIMPLRRGADGRLGVEVNGNGSQAVVAELRAVRNEIVNLRETVDENDRDQGAALVDVVSDLRIQIGELREELRTNRLRAQ